MLTNSANTHPFVLCISSYGNKKVFIQWPIDLQVKYPIMFQGHFSAEMLQINNVLPIPLLYQMIHPFKLFS